MYMCSPNTNNTQRKEFFFCFLMKNIAFVILINLYDIELHYIQ